MRSWAAFHFSFVVGLTLLILDVPVARAQSAPRARLEFDVASIRPHVQADTVPTVEVGAAHGRATFMNVTVRSLIRQAYGLKVYPLSGGGDALSLDRYDVVAQAPADASQAQMMLMLQTLLADRFKLVLHRETRELPVFALVVAKNGPRVHSVADDGSAGEIGSGDGHQIKARHISMRTLASVLQGHVGDPVTDETHLTGVFDLNLDFRLDESLSAEGPTLFEAVQRQLGLKLESRKGPVEVVVIDHVERPTPN